MANLYQVIYSKLTTLSGPLINHRRAIFVNGEYFGMQKTTKVRVDFIARLKVNKRYDLESSNPVISGELIFLDWAPSLYTGIGTSSEGVCALATHKLKPFEANGASLTEALAKKLTEVLTAHLDANLEVRYAT